MRDDRSCARTSQTSTAGIDNSKQQRMTMKFDQLGGSLRNVARLALGMGLLWLGGCTTYVQTQVAAFSDWQGSDATRTYAFTRTTEQQNSIEQKTYEAITASELSTHGFRQVPETDARYRVALAYSIRSDMVTVGQEVYADPWPMYGGFYGRGYGWGGGWGGWGGWSYPTGYVDQSYPIFVNSLQIRITERDSGREVYKVNASNSGGEPSLVHAMPYLVRSALADFPLGNGTVRTVNIPFDKTGGVSNEAAVTPQ
jgi:Domain of unknown function (DUF4136)